MFNWFKSKPEEKKDNAPEIIGLYLGGSFEIDPLHLRLIEPELLIEGAASQHMIQAVGEVRLDTGGKILRFYTDDDAFLQVVLDGGDGPEHITDVKLWYFYDTTTVGSEVQWKSLIESDISKPNYPLDEHLYQRVWNALGETSPPVAMTEKTWELDGDISETDQFVMLYERPIADGRFEALLVSAEEKIVNNQPDRCLVRSSGFNLSPAELKING